MESEVIYNSIFETKEHLDVKDIDIRNKTKKDSFYVLGVISTFIILFQIKVAGISVFKYIAFLFGMWFFLLNKGRLKFSVFKQDYSTFFLVLILCVVISLTGSSHHKDYSLRMLIDFFFIIFLCYGISTSRDKNLQSFIDGIRLSCIIQIIWCSLQFLAWYGARVDINKEVFVDGLHLLTSASKYENNGTVLCISGLSHHPSNLIVVIIFTLALFKKPWKWPVCFFIAFISRNSTTLIASALSIMLYIIPGIFDMLKEKTIRRKTVPYIVFIILVLPIVVIAFRDAFSHHIGKLLLRLKTAYEGSGMDGNTFAHVGYYTFLPDVWNRLGIREILCGYSYGWTGGMFSLFYGEELWMYYYRSVLNVGVESDPMNYLYGVGIIGTLFLYRWLIKDMLLGYKINRTYAILFLSITVSGVFYCIQYAFVIISEVVLSELIARKIDVFS